ncbi:hypothetical protein EJB05_54372, partial [Eragrostis curvula]
MWPVTYNPRANSHLMKEMKGRPCAFVDPAPMTIDNLHDSRKEVVQLLVRAIRTYKDKEYIMFPHNTGGHWVLVVISVKKKKCCQQPSGSKLCGFYVAQHMLIIAEACISDKSIDDIAFPGSPFEDAVLHNIRDRIASFLMAAKSRLHCSWMQPAGRKTPKWGREHR